MSSDGGNSPGGDDRTRIYRPSSVPGSPTPGPAAPQGPTPLSPVLITGVIAVLIAMVVAVVALTGGDDDDGLSTIDDAPTVVAQPTASEQPAATPTTEAATPESTVEPIAVIPTVSELASAVVQIQLMLSGQIVCTGSGTIIEADGIVLTNSHVIAQSPQCPHDRIGIAITDVPELPPTLLFEGDVLVDDATLDLAVVRIARTLDGSPVTETFPTVDIGDSDTLTLGDSLRVIGYPGIGGQTVTFTEGTISGFVSIPGFGDRSWLKTDATISGGNSGGLAVNQLGQIVGIPTIVGSGEGNITDCRVVNDTNGDGRIDQNDTCVPVGGFINGIRPVNLAAPLLAQAATATPIDQGEPMVDEPMTPDRPRAFNATWSSDVGADGTAVDSVVVVDSGVPQLCLTWDFEDVPANAPVVVTWFVDGVEEPGFGFTGTNDGETSGGYFSCITNSGPGLAEGVYEMVWLVDDLPAFSHSIYIGGNREEITVDIVNDTDTALCVVQFAPSETLSFGLNRISALVDPGDSVRLRMASGRYDARVIDCDGATRIEDADGTRIAADSTLRVT